MSMTYPVGCPHCEEVFVLTFAMVGEPGSMAVNYVADTSPLRDHIDAAHAGGTVGPAAGS